MYMICMIFTVCHKHPLNCIYLHHLSSTFGSYHHTWRYKPQCELSGPDIPITGDTLEDVVTLIPGALGRTSIPGDVAGNCL